MFRKLFFLLGGFVFGLKWSKPDDFPDILDLIASGWVTPWSGSEAQFRKGLSKAFSQDEVDFLIEEEIKEDGGHFDHIPIDEKRLEVLERMESSGLISNLRSMRVRFPQYWDVQEGEYMDIPLLLDPLCRYCGADGSVEVPKDYPLTPSQRQCLERGDRCWNCADRRAIALPTAIDFDYWKALVNDEAVLPKRKFGDSPTNKPKVGDIGTVIEDFDDVEWG